MGKRAAKAVDLGRPQGLFQFQIKGAWSYLRCGTFLFNVFLHTLAHLLHVLGIFWRDDVWFMNTTGPMLGRTHKQIEKQNKSGLLMKWLNEDQKLGIIFLDAIAREMVVRVRK
jgi:hypothetical protein